MLVAQSFNRRDVYDPVFGITMKSDMKIIHRPDRDWVPLSAAQSRLWILDRFDKGDASWNRPLAVRLRGQLEAAALQQSLSEIVRRHEILRTMFAEVDGQPRQRVCPAAAVNLEVRDLGVLPEGDRLREARRIVAQEAMRLFDLKTGRLLQSLLIRLSAEDHVLLILMHHIVFDGWSETILLNELAALYGVYSRGETKSRLPELTIQYADFADWQSRRLAEGALESQLTYWRQQLKDLSPLSLMTDLPRTVTPDHRRANHSIVLPLSLTEDLKELSRQRQATLFMTLFTVFHALLGRYTGQQDFAIGVPIAGRTMLETERLIGCFMNILVIRADNRVDDNFEQALERVRTAALQAYEHQDVPFEKLVEELRPERSPNRWPLFQVMFNMRNMPRSEARRAGHLTIVPFSFDSILIGGLDLSLEAVERPNGLDCSFSYPCALFEPETIHRLAQHFIKLLANIVDRPQQRMSALPLLSNSERRQLLVEWNSTAKEYPRHQCLHELFEAQVERNPDAVSVICGTSRLSYRELDERSNQVARYLRRRGVSSEVLVGLCLDRSVDLLLLLLGILKAGGAYVPFDPNYPEARLRLMIRDARLPILITSARLALSRKLSGRDSAADLLIVDQDWAAIKRESSARLLNAADPENLAYVIYTSGSSGNPKAVMVPHLGVCNYLTWRSDYFPLTAADRVLQTSSFSFDDSVWEFFEPLSVGATVIVPEAHEYQDVSKLVALLAKHRVTAGCFVPSLLEAVIEEPAFASCRDLRRVTTGGESLSARLKNRFVERCSAALYNGYGPTEATIAATFYGCERAITETPVPIGRPIANAQVYILDIGFEPVPVGVAGEIYIGGAGVCRGYLNNPVSTAENFLPDPFAGKPGRRLYKTGDWGRYLSDGNIQFIARRDHQVKIRGYRIELEEVEQALHDHPDVRDAVAVAEPRAGEKRLVAYYVPLRQSAELTPNNLRSFLVSRLPSYMLPSAFVPLGRLPRTRTGKVDRQALTLTKELERELCSEYVPPRSDLERRLAELWSALLGISPIGIRDNFFEVGGHSLLATRLISRLRETYRIDLQLRAIFEHPTIEDFALFLLSQITLIEVGDTLGEGEALSDQKAQSLLQTELKS